jgi:hypothetical protein
VPFNNVQEKKMKKDQVGRAENEVANFVALACLPIHGKEIEGVGCAGLGEELVKVSTAHAKWRIFPMQRI